MPYAPGVHYDASPLYEGLASAGRSVAAGRNARADRALREKALNQQYYDSEQDRGFRYYEAEQKKGMHEDDMKARGSFNIQDIAGAPGSKLVMNPGTGQFQVLQPGKKTPEPDTFNAQPITDPSSGATVGYYFGGKTHWNSTGGGLFGGLLGGQGGSGAPPTIGEMTNPSTPDERRNRAQEIEGEIRRNPSIAARPSGFDRQGETRQQALDRLRGSIAAPPAASRPAAPPMTTSAQPMPSRPAPARAQAQPGGGGGPVIDVNDTPLPQGTATPPPAAAGAGLFPQPPGAAAPAAPAAPPGRPAGRVRVISPDGTPGTIWADQLEGALAAGYRRAE